MAENSDTTSSAGEVKLLAGYLVSALDMEDEINNSIYEDYLDKKNWPKSIDPQIFKTITQYLNVLIEDTRKHRKIIAGLIEKYGRNKPIQ
jgi:hypothetical protein